MFINLDLHLFDEGATETGATSSAAGESSSAEGRSADTSTASEVSFDDYIKSHQEEYKQHVESIVKQRIKDHKETKSNLDAAYKALDKLAFKYKAKAGDYKAIINAIESDDSVYEQEAIERGVSVDTVKYEQQLKNENSTMKAQIEEFERQKQDACNRAIIQRWTKEAEALKEIYPDFDLDKEIEDKTFVHLLGVPNLTMRQAYDALHPEARDSRVSNKTAQQVVQNIAARGLRPAESIAKTQQAVNTKQDVMQMTSEEFKQYKAKVLGGAV